MGLMGKAVTDDLINTADRRFITRAVGSCQLLVSGVWVANALCEDSEAFNKMIKCHAKLMFTASWLGLSQSRSAQN